jgi:hypothetical protein
MREACCCQEFSANFAWTAKCHVLWAFSAIGREAVLDARSQLMELVYKLFYRGMPNGDNFLTACALRSPAEARWANALSTADARLRWRMLRTGDGCCALAMAAAHWRGGPRVLRIPGPSVRSWCTRHGWGVLLETPTVNVRWQVERDVRWGDRLHPAGTSNDKSRK